MTDFLLADRVQETTTTTGTGTISLAGASTQAQTFVAGIGTTNKTSYCILSGNGTDWEVGIGTVTTGTPSTLSRDTIIASSNSNAAISLTGTSTVFCSSIAATTIQPADNIFVNGAMEIDQPNEGASLTLTSGSNQYAVDGWIANFNSATAAVTSQRVTDAPPGAANSVKVTVGTGATVATGNYLTLTGSIEANELVETQFGTASAKMLALAFWIKSSIGSYTGTAALRNWAGTRSYLFNFTVTSANTWQKIVILIPGDTTGTWVTSGTAGGAHLSITMAAGATFQGTNAAWQAANVLGTASTTNTILSTSAASFQVGLAKLEIGSAPTPLVRESYVRMLHRCQRHYEKSYDIGTALGTASATGCESFTSVVAASEAPVRFKVPARATPTMTIYNFSSGATGSVYDANAAAARSVVSIDQGGTNGCCVNFSGVAGNRNVFHWVKDARL